MKEYDELKAELEKIKGQKVELLKIFKKKVNQKLLGHDWWCQ